MNGGTVLLTNSESEKLPVAVGSSSIETLCAYIASRLYPAYKTTVETQLQAFVYARQLSDQKLDVKAKFKALCHAKGFVAESQVDLSTHDSDDLSQQYQPQAIDEPSYYCPKEPTISFEVAASHTHISANTPLICATVADVIVNNDTPGCLAPETFEGIFAAIEQLCPSDNNMRDNKVRDNVKKGFHWYKPSPWTAYSMDWQVTVYSVSNLGQPDLKLNQEVPELLEGVKINGSSVVSGHASLVLKQALIDFIRRIGQNTLNKTIAQIKPQNVQSLWQRWLKQWPHDGKPTEFETWLAQAPEDAFAGDIQPPQVPLLAVEVFKFINKNTILSSVLSGFNEALLAQNQSLHLPIRCGVMTVDKLDIIDTFVQVHCDINPSQLITSEQLTPKSSYIEGCSRVVLPPRVVLPCRLDFNWLAYRDSQPTDFVCGWLMPNLKNNSLWVYQSDGKIVGQIDANACWQALPGNDVVTDIKNLDSHYLQQVLEQLTGDKKALFNQFTQVLTQAIDNIDPEPIVGLNNINCLLGRPIAIIRANISLQLKEQALAQNLVANHVNPDAAQVVFPIRIGDFEQYNEGTIGYWLESSSGQLLERFETTASMTNRAPFGSQIIASYDETDPNLTLSIGQSKTLTLLVDPRASVQASSGILPVKVLKLPDDAIESALQNIEQFSVVRPVLSRAGNIEIPLAKQAGAYWSYLHKSRHQWIETNERGLMDKKMILEEIPMDGQPVWQALITENWLSNMTTGRKSDDSVFATVMPKNRRSKPLSALLKKHQSIVDEIFNRGVLRHVVNTEEFAEEAIFHEGWLKLKRDQT